MEAKKLAAKDGISDIETWNAHLGTQLEEVDNKVEMCENGSMTTKRKQRTLLRQKNLAKRS